MESKQEEIIKNAGDLEVSVCRCSCQFKSFVVNLNNEVMIHMLFTVIGIEFKEREIFRSDRRLDPGLVHI